MRKFVDRKGREWAVDLTLGAALRWAQGGGPDLIDGGPEAIEGVLDRTASRAKFPMLLYEFLSKSSRPGGGPLPAFDDWLDDLTPCFSAAHEAWERELADFFLGTRPAMGEMLRDAIAEAADAQSAARARALAALAEARQGTSGAGSTGSPASSASSPAA